MGPGLRSPPWGAVLWGPVPEAAGCSLHPAPWGPVMAAAAPSRAAGSVGRVKGGSWEEAACGQSSGPRADGRGLWGSGQGCGRLLRQTGPLGAPRGTAGAEVGDSWVWGPRELEGPAVTSGVLRRCSCRPPAADFGRVDTHVAPGWRHQCCRAPSAGALRGRSPAGLLRLGWPTPARGVGEKRAWRLAATPASAESSSVRCPGIGWPDRPEAASRGGGPSWLAAPPGSSQVRPP